MKQAKIAFLVALLAAPVHAQEATGFMLLQDRYGELCTMCVGNLVCTNAENSATTTYAFQKKDFLGQMMTVLDFVPGIGRGVWEKREVNITEKGASGSATPRRETARLSIKEAKIEAGGTLIDRRSGNWSTTDGKALGTCTTPTAEAAK